MTNAVTVTSVSQLNTAIEAADTLVANTGTYTITLGGNIALGTTALEAINLNTGNVLDIIGNGNTLSGGGTTTPERGLFVYAGTVSIANLTIAAMDAVGGNAVSGGGGGAGLGGGLFVAGTNVVNGTTITTGGNVTLNNVAFTGDSAQGGAGGNNAQVNEGGGGGLGGNGGGGILGGGGGVGGNGGGNTGGAGGTGIIPGAGGGEKGSSGGAGGASGGGGGSGIIGGAHGGGGGVDGGTGGAGGFGGGGGGAGSYGGDGGFGGGGGAGVVAHGGTGGFGGGGGAGIAASGGLGGFGGGKGGERTGVGSNGGGGGGGGLAAGGDIFIQQGGVLTIAGGTIAAGSLTAGLAGGTATAGSAFGSGIFIENTSTSVAQTITLAPGSGQTLTINGAIGDQAGSGGTIANDTKGALVDAGTGLLVLGGTNTYTGGTTLEAGTLQVASAANIGSGTLTFGALATTLDVTGGQTNGSTFANVLNGFQNNGTIDLTAVSFALGASAIVAGTTLTLTDGAFTEYFSLAATTARPIQVFQDSGIGTELSSVCFLAGTRIATPDGEISIENLKAGDRVKTLNGETRRIVWVGTGKVLATRGRRTAATPVLIRKGAFADNVPNADLRVTKAHGFYLDSVLIPAEFLVNNRSILWDDRAQEVTIYHIELETHDVILANGAPAETFRDDGNRWLFHNVNSHRGQPPQEPFAPVLTGGPAVGAVWRRLLDRAGPRPSVPLTDDPDLHLLVDGLRLEPEESAGPYRTFFVPGKPARIEIASRDAVPVELGLAHDPRSLGVALRQIEVHQGPTRTAIAADDPRLTDGFHDYEPADNLRWTNGCATLPLERLTIPGRGPIKLVLTLGGATRYPDLGAPTAARAA